MTDTPSRAFRERLLPTPWLFVTLLLIIPAVMLTITPLNAAAALPAAIAAYVVIALSLALMSPVVQVSNGQLIAGRARVPVNLLGNIELLDDASLRRVIGPGADARAYLLVRGYIHRGLRIELLDPSDPTPYWVVTTRKPKSLSAAIAAEQAKLAG